MHDRSEYRDWSKNVRIEVNYVNFLNFIKVKNVNEFK